MSERLDVLQSGDPAARPRPVRRALILVVLVLLAAGLRRVDEGQRRHETAVLTSCVDTAQNAIADASARISMISNYIAPALNSGPSSEIEAGLFDLVEQAAGRARPSLERARTRCDEATVRPWHRALRSARTSYLTYLDARLAMIRDIALDGRESFEQRPDVIALRERARARARRVSIALR